MLSLNVLGLDARLRLERHHLTGQIRPFGEILDLGQQRAALRGSGLCLLQALLHLKVLVLEHAHLHQVPFLLREQFAFSGQIGRQRRHHEDDRAG